MPLSPSSPSFLQAFIRKITALLSRQAAVACSLTACLLLPASLPAEEASPEALKPIAGLALHQPSDTANLGLIRMKLYGIGGARRQAPQTGLSAPDSDELKKQAQVRYLAAKFGKHEATLREYVDLAWAEAAKSQRLNPELLIAIIQKESAFRPSVQSRYGAQGLMQVVPRWHREKLKPSESLFDPEVNIRVGAEVLEEYLAQADGNMDNALRKYSGNSRNYANSVLKESRYLARIAEQAADDERS